MVSRAVHTMLRPSLNGKRIDSLMATYLGPIDEKGNLSMAVPEVC